MASIGDLIVEKYQFMLWVARVNRIKSQEPEDVVQETALRLVSDDDIDVDGIENHNGYLSASVRYTVSHELQKSKALKRQAIPVEDYPTWRAEDPESAVERMDLRDQLMELIVELPEKLQDSVMRKLAGEEFGKYDGTNHQRYRRAVIELRRIAEDAGLMGLKREGV